MGLDFLSAWEEICGPPHGAHCRPVRIRAGALVIACEGARAAFLQHDSQRLIERVNLFFGHEAITRIAFVERSGGGVESLPQEEEAELDEEAKARLERIVEPVEDERLREGLRRMGRGILSRKRG